MNNKFKIILLPVITYILSISFVIIPNDIKKANDFFKQFDNFGYSLKVILVFVAITVFTLHHFSSIFGKINKFNQFQKVRPDLIEKNLKSFMEKYKKRGIELRLNVMLSKRKFIIWKRLFQFERPFLLQKQFETVFDYNMSHNKDKDLGLITKQGVSGLAYENQEGKQIIVDFSKTKESFYLNQEQAERTKGIKFIISTPILKWDPETQKLTDKTIGVVNIDSRKNSFDEIQRKSLIAELMSNSYIIADFVSLLY